MSGLQQIFKLKTASETVGIEIENPVDYKDFLKRIITPIIDILCSIDIEEQIVKYIPSVGVTLKDLNEAIYKKKNKELSEITADVLSHYNLLEQRIKKDTAIRWDIQIKVLALLDTLRDFDSVYLGMAMTRQEQLEKALADIESDGDIEDLEKTIAGTALVFFSILVFVKEGMKNDIVLEKLFRIADEYSEALESWVDTIDMMSNPESVEAMKEAEKIAIQ
jgi:hypothetical protein